MSPKEENIVVGTHEMMEAALAEVQEMVRLGTWPKSKRRPRVRAAKSPALSIADRIARTERHTLKAAE